MSLSTTILNLYGGPGSGKSTLAAAVFAELKRRGHSAELVTEFVKDWVWEGKQIGPYDQITIAAEQIRREARLHGKVEYIVTDSPLLLPPFYETYYHKTQLTLALVNGFRSERAKQGVREAHFVLPKYEIYQAEGRYETKEQAEQINEQIKAWVREHATSVPCYLTDRSEDEIVLHLRCCTGD